MTCAERSRSCREAIRWCWCPLAEVSVQKTGGNTKASCNLHREMQVGYRRLVTISTDNVIETNEFRTAVGAGWTLLADPGRRV